MTEKELGFGGLRMFLPLLDIVLLCSLFLLLFLSIFWLTVFFTVKDDKAPRWSGKVPFVSIIVPAYNEEENIAATITSALKLDYPKEKIEIIIVNDGSKDKTREIVEQLIVYHSKDNIILLNQDNKGKAAALNKGLTVACGELYASLDADSIVEPYALKEMTRFFEDHNVAAVCPLLKVYNPLTLIEKVQWYEYVINMFYKYLNAKLNCIHVTPGPFSLYRTTVVKTIGGYDETTITEDQEIAIRLQKHQYKIVQTFDAVVHTKTPQTWKTLFAQRVRWYRGAVENTIQYKKLMFNKEYGDFGFIRMPSILLGGALSIILTGFFLWDISTKLFRDFNYLHSINFDIIPLLQGYKFQIDLLTLPYFRYAVAATLIAIGLFVMIYSYKTIGEKITRYGNTAKSMFTYLFLYSLFISIVWVYIAFSLATQRKREW